MLPKMVSVNVIAFVILKIKENVRCHLIFSFIEFSENVNSFV